MNRTSTSRWARIPLAAGAAVLLAVSAPATAWAATGPVQVTLMPEGKHITVNDPTDGHCYTVHELSPGSTGKFRALANNTDKSFHLYGDSSCGSEAHTPIAPGGTLVGLDFGSFKLS
ncbi:hypothetical protein [Peterkaempfera griseoplana]|uniref:hypothetical protein n=1 Tax=Peterkaempfera griseoplana TaxID=66896 RepID=UPI0006E22751|nr:hypothetical protein [Peterkaempfera griseoplana]